MAEDWSTSVQPELQVGDLTSQYIDIDGNVPPELVAFYNTHYDSPNIQASIRFVGITANGIAYYYQVFGVNASGTTGVYATGWVGYNGAVQEEYSVIFNTSSAVPPQTIYGLVTSGIVQFGNNNPGTFQMNWQGVDFVLSSINNWDLSAVGSDWQINSNSQGRGTIFYDQITVGVNTGAVAGTNYEVYNSGNITFAPGRAYAVTLYNSRISSAALQSPDISLHKTNATGTTLVSGTVCPITVANTQTPLTPNFIFVNNGANAVTAPLSLGIAPSVATLVTLVSAAFGSWGFEVKDIGDTTMYVGPHSIG